MFDKAKSEAGSEVEESFNAEALGSHERTRPKKAALAWSVCNFLENRLIFRLCPDPA